MTLSSWLDLISYPCTSVDGVGLIMGALVIRPAYCVVCINKGGKQYLGLKSLGNEYAKILGLPHKNDDSFIKEKNCSDKEDMLVKLKKQLQSAQELQRAPCS